MRRLRAGVAIATISGGSSDIVIFGVLKTKSALLDVRRGDVRFVVGNTEVKATEPATLFEGYSIPEYFSTQFGYQHPEASTLQMEHADWIAASVRLSCSGFPASALPLVGNSLSLRSSTWEVNGIHVQDAGFPIMKSMTRTETDPDIRRARGNEQGRHRSQRWLIGPHNDVALPAVSVCVQYLYRDGYSLRHMSDFAAWYLLLGVKRILVFDNMEPDRMPAGEVRVRAARHHAELMTLSTSLGDRFQVIRGLCMYDTMRRAPLNANCQVLAGNIALQAVRAADAAHPAAYVLMADFDEYLVPPIRVRAGNVWDANVSGERPSTSKGGSVSLAGALGRLVQHISDGGNVTSQQLASSRVRVVAGTRRAWTRGVPTSRKLRGSCIKFASIYFVPPSCAGAEQVTSSLQGSESQLPAVLRYDRRLGTDWAEAGPSHTWRNVTSWDHRVRAKFLMDARVEDAVSAIHMCCLPRGRSGRPPPESACSTVEHVPLEEWHVRHLKPSLKGLSRKRMGWTPQSSTIDQPPLRGCRERFMQTLVQDGEPRKFELQQGPSLPAYPPNDWSEEATRASQVVQEIVATSMATNSAHPQ